MAFVFVCMRRRMNGDLDSKATRPRPEQKKAKALAWRLLAR